MTPGRSTVLMPDGQATARSRAAEEELISRDPCVKALRLIFHDDEELSTSLGRPAHVTRIRYKPASSVVITFVTSKDTETGDRWSAHGWLAGYSDDAKVGKTLMTAQRVGVAAERIERVHATVHGSVTADRRLSGTLFRLNRAFPELTRSSTLLRHNPHRRVLLRASGPQADLVVKVWPRVRRAGAEGRLGQVELLDHLIAAGIPAMGFRHPKSLRDVVIGEWWGAGDLATVQSPDAAYRAGTALAAVHASCVHPGRFALASRDAKLSSCSESARAAVAIAVVLPEFAHRARLLVQAIDERREGSIRPRHPVLTHGDFSPAQVLVGRDEIRLIDFDRAGWSVPERDLGSFAAASILLRRPDLAVALFDGYTDAGGELHPEELHPWLAHSLLSRAIDPFRYRAPDWAGDVERILAAAEQALER